MLKVEEIIAVVEENIAVVDEKKIGDEIERIKEQVEERIKEKVEERSQFPRSSNGNNSILVVMDYFTKWPEAYPISDQEATTVSEVLVQHWISRFGVPLQLHSDQGRNFKSTVCKRLCEILVIDKTQTTVLHP
ncbi:retrovirus-related Pol polyprotein from transposon 412 [Trichonephila clavipes]|nr:retrovirus-related Pol polyprotein from transposon 412 [Trichonephila clavipes]